MDNGTTPTCYAVNGNIIKPEPLLLPCGGSSTNNTFCCVQGHICTEDAICRFTETLADTSTSGYYVGGCTDETFSDPTCSKACGALAHGQR